MSKIYQNSTTQISRTLPTTRGERWSRRTRTVDPTLASSRSSAEERDRPPTATADRNPATAHKAGFLSWFFLSNLNNFRTSWTGSCLWIVLFSIRNIRLKFNSWSRNFQMLFEFSSNSNIFFPLWYNYLAFSLEKREKMVQMARTVFLEPTYRFS